MTIIIMTLMMIMIFEKKRRIDFIDTIFINEQNNVKKKHVEHKYVLTQYLFFIVVMKMNEIRVKK